MVVIRHGIIIVIVNVEIGVFDIRPNVVVRLLVVVVRVMVVIPTAKVRIPTAKVRIPTATATVLVVIVATWKLVKIVPQDLGVYGAVTI